MSKDIGAEFSSFLMAYSMEDYYKLSLDDVSDDTINAIYNKNVDKFSVWLKIPQWMRQKYHNKVPAFILEQAAVDPVFTESDALAAEEKMQKQNPYSVIPDYVSASDSYRAAQDIGIAFGVAEIAAINLHYSHLSQKGYTDEESKAISLNSQILKSINHQTDFPPELVKSYQEKIKKETRDIIWNKIYRDKPEKLILIKLVHKQSGIAEPDYMLTDLIKRSVELGHLAELYSLTTHQMYKKLNQEQHTLLEKELKRSHLMPQKSFQQAADALTFIQSRNGRIY